MSELGDFRVRHSMLFSLCVQTKNYLECIEHGYLGPMENFEEKLVEKLKSNVELMEKVLWNYFEEEEKIISGE